MRVKMLKDAPVTVDGVNTVDAEAGDELEVGDGVADSLFADGRAAPLAGDEPFEDATPKRSRRKKADADGITADADGETESKDAGAADENKDAGDDPSAEGEPVK